MSGVFNCFHKFPCLDFNGVSLSGGDILINPDLDLAHELQGWWESEGCRQERRSRRKQLTLSQLGFDRIPMSDLSKRDLLYGINVDGVRSCVKRSKYSHGISRKKLYNALKGGIVQQKVDEVLDWLASEGYIYTTPTSAHGVLTVPPIWRPC